MKPLSNPSPAHAEPIARRHSRSRSCGTLLAVLVALCPLHRAQSEDPAVTLPTAAPAPTDTAENAVATPVRSGIKTDGSTAPSGDLFPIPGAGSSPTPDPTAAPAHLFLGVFVALAQHADDLGLAQEAADGQEADAVSYDDVVPWPLEADRPITEGSHAAATEMKLVIDGKEIKKPIVKGDKRITFKMELKAGQKKLQGWISAGDKEISGAYYCYINKL